MSATRPYRRLITAPRLRLIGVVAIGAAAVFLRVYFYLFDRSLWLDEAMLAYNIVHRSLRGLLLPLEYDQGAPLGFLLMVKAVTDVLGSRELVLRLVPLLAGVAAIPLFWLVAEQSLLGLGPLLALALLAANDRLIYYSSEFKQYSTDVLATLALCYLFLQCLRCNRSRAAIAGFGLGGAAAFWLSHPSVFVAAGLALSLALALASQKDWRRLAWLAGVGLVWAADLAGLYLVSLRQLAANADLISYWSSAYAPWPPWAHADWYGRALAAALANPAGLPVSVITLGLLLLGAASLARRRWPLLVAAGAPLVFTLVASGFQKYPFSDRLLLFAVPLVLLVTAEGVERLRAWLMRLARRAPAAGRSSLGWIAVAGLSVYLLYPAALAGWNNLRTPFNAEDIRPEMAYLQGHRLPGDTIYVYYGAVPAFQFYAPYYQIGLHDYSLGQYGVTDPGRYLVDIDGLAGQPRVWFVFSHVCVACPASEEAFFVAHLNQIGVKQAEVRAEGTSLYLYDLDAKPTASEK